MSTTVPATDSQMKDAQEAMMRAEPELERAKDGLVAAEDGLAQMAKAPEEDAPEANVDDALGACAPRSSTKANEGLVKP